MQQLEKILTQHFCLGHVNIDGHNIEVSTHDQFVFAGPCSVESEEQITRVAQLLNSLNIRVMRGGIYKPRTSAHSFQGLGLQAAQYMHKACQTYGLLSACEVMSEDDIEQLYPYVDIFQVGARNAQNFRLLAALGSTNKPVIIKRGMGETLDELIASTSYLESAGNTRIMLCERGIRTFEHALRNTLDISAVPYVHATCPYPVIIDPSHAAGMRPYVPSLACAGIAAGADALLIEVHPQPEQACSDAQQQLNLTEFSQLYGTLKSLRDVRKNYHG